MRTTQIRSDDGKRYMMLKDPDKNLWGVTDSEHRGNRMSRDGEWDFEPMPSNRTDDYIKEHSFTFAEAKKVLEEYEERIKVK